MFAFQKEGFSSRNMLPGSFYHLLLLLSAWQRCLDFLKQLEGVKGSFDSEPRANE